MTKDTMCAYCRKYATCTFHGKRYLCAPCAQAHLGEHP